MSENLRMDERVRAEDALYESMFKRGDNKNIMIGVGIAAILHLAVLLVHLPVRIFQADENDQGIRKVPQINSGVISTDSNRISNHAAPPNSTTRWFFQDKSFLHFPFRTDHE